MNLNHVLALVLPLALMGAACKKDATGDARGPMEKAGAWVDDTAKKTGDAVEKGAEETGKGFDKAGHAVGDTFSGSSGSASKADAGL